MLKVCFYSLFIPVYVNVCAQQIQTFRDPASKKYGLKDAAGKIIVTPKYDTVEAFKNNVAVVGKKITWSDYKYGLINKTGKEIVPLVYETVYTDAGIVVVQADDKYGFMDKTGKKLSPLKYNNVWEFSDGIAGVEIYDRDKGEGKWGFVDNTGKVVIPVKYDRVLSNKKGVIAEREGKYFAVAKSGKEIPLNYERIGHAAYGLLLVKQNNKFGFINAKGEVVIPLKYDNAWDFSTWQRTGYLSNVRIGNKSGFIDTSGKEVIPLTYDWAGLFREGLAKVTMNPVPAGESKNGFVDSAGHLVIPMIYNSAGNFSEGMAAVSKKSGGRNFFYGYIDRSGKEVIPFSFESADEFSEGLAAVKLNGKWGFIDKEGNVVIPYKYKSVINGFNYKRAKVVLDDDKLITIDKTGKEN